MTMQRQTGMSILLVVFMVAVLSTLGLVITTLSSTQHFTASLSGQSLQTYFAARTGIEYAVARIVAGSGCDSISSPLTIDGNSVAVACAVSGTFDEGAATTYDVFEIDVVASIGGFSAPDASNRRLRATIKFP